VITFKRNTWVSVKVSLEAQVCHLLEREEAQNNCLGLKQLNYPLINIQPLMHGLDRKIDEIDFGHYKDYGIEKCP